MDYWKYKVLIHNDSQPQYQQNSNELYHWGIKGMKWGVRRFQNEDGTLTEEGKKRYLKDSDLLEKQINDNPKIKQLASEINDAKKSIENVYPNIEKACNELDSLYDKHWDKVFNQNENDLKRNEEEYNNSLETILNKYKNDHEFAKSVENYASSIDKIYQNKYEILSQLLPKSNYFNKVNVYNKRVEIEKQLGADIWDKYVYNPFSQGMPDLEDVLEYFPWID